MAIAAFVKDLCSDGWSMGVFIQELTALYNAYIQGLSSPLNPLSIQYGDFTLWQRQWLQGEVLENQLNYWKKQLADAPTFLPLPTDKPRPAVQTFTGVHQEFQLSLELTQKLTELSQQQGVTMFMTLLAAYGILLYRYTGQSDILIGTPIANRNRREIESLIGFFVNTLVMQTDCSENPSFQELLMRVREMSLGAYAHQDLPFEMLVEALPIALGLFVVLIAHEIGHWLLARRHQVRLSWPFFLPAVQVGSFGAITRFESLVPSRKALFDIALAGPGHGQAQRRRNRQGKFKLFL